MTFEITSTSYKNHLVLTGWSFYPTTDDWYPNFENNLIAIKSVQSLNDSEQFTVIAMGADDFGLETLSLSQDEARSILLKLPSIITIDYLKSIGFEKF